jgi:hypothetical protein
MVTVEREAMIPLVVAAFAQFLHDRTLSVPTEPSAEAPARRFWAELVAFEPVTDTVGVLAALEELIRQARLTP